MNNDKVFYSLSYEDIQPVAEELLDRTLTEEECLFLEEKISEQLDWFSIIEMAILENIVNDEKE